MKLSDLTGASVLDAVDYGTEQCEAAWGDQLENCQALRFRLNGVCYAAVEDPQDGYRSCMRELLISNAPIRNTFAPVPVVGILQDKDEYGQDSELLKLVAAATGKTILTIGTKNTYDYYPCYVANFQPENMPQNEGE